LPRTTGPHDIAAMVGQLAKDHWASRHSGDGGAACQGTTGPHDIAAMVGQGPLGFTRSRRRRRRRGQLAPDHWALRDRGDDGDGGGSLPRTTGLYEIAATTAMAGAACPGPLGLTT
jgi:hypothetical protein